MSKNKLARFAENETFKNLFQHTQYDIRNNGFPFRGKWHSEYFKNENPIILELGCGKGEYTVALSQLFPQANFIGIDKKGARIWRGCKDCIENNITNVAFIRSKIEDIDCFFARNEISEIWITFPDPQPKRERKRLISPNFLNKYKKILRPDGIIHLKTDSRLLYEYLLEIAQSEQYQILENIEDIYKKESNPILRDIQTFYEKKWLADDLIISYIKFRIN